MKGKLLALYYRLRAEYGFLDWWPADTKTEVIVGAILVQNTSWNNAQKAIANLKGARMLNPQRLSGAKLGRLEELIRPSGFYRRKALRLKQVFVHIRKKYLTLHRFLSQDKVSLRNELLLQSGIGKETADSIVLYAAEKPAFVVDAYTKRIMGRVYGTNERMGYDELQSSIQSAIPEDVLLYKDFHAQFVEHAKKYCKKKPLCPNCPLSCICAYAARAK
ncbi:MAG: endonuclease [Candidatus Micrarchaeota archaeon]|nr:endonuclease [Candidatus Micrarchaeota archaeon]MDE1864556.1 endonuclease [Candidatus Micrarchaeota archaeon]